MLREDANLAGAFTLPRHSTTSGIPKPKRGILTNFKDYDALTAERESFVRRIGGEDIEFRKVLPARLVLDIRRKASKKMSDEEQESFGFDLIEQIIGKESYEHISNHLSVEQLTDLVGDALAYYGLSDNSGEEGKGGTPATEPKVGPQSPSSESSPAGEHSTPTSSDSTPTPDESSTQGDSTGTPSSVVSPIYPLAHSS